MYRITKVVDCGGKTGHTTRVYCKVGDKYMDTSRINIAHEMIESYANQEPKCDCRFDVKEIE